MTEKRRITAEDLYRFKLVSDPQISPDGQHVIFCVQWVEQKTEKKYTNLWLAATDDGRPPRQFTYGKQNDTRPRWSPDGTQIAFLSNRGDEKQAQLHLIPLHGGEARPLTEMSGAFGSYEWSPDGTQFLCQFRKKDADAVEREKDEQKKKLGVVARHISRLDYRVDGAGYAPQEKWHIWTVDASSGEGVQLTDGDFAEVEPRWSPDGSQILFVSNRHERSDLEVDATELYLIPAAGGEMQQVAAPYGRKFAPSFSPDGRTISYLGRKQTGKWFQNAQICVVGVDGSDARMITADRDIHFSSVTNGDLGGSPPLARPQWSSDGRTLYAMSSVHGNQPLQAVSVADGSVTAVLAVNSNQSSVTSDQQPTVIGPFSFSADQSKMAFWGGSMADPGQIWLHDFASGETRPLTTFNADLFAELELGDISEVTFASKDGTELQGWVLTPPGFDASQQYPSILEIHGGPQTQYGRLFMHELHYLSANDYVVYWSNPRGSQGYGEAFAGAIYGKWGTIDYDDVMAWADYAAAQPFIDTERMGVTGGSYGGYMTVLIIGKTHRFKAAVAQRAVSNVISFYGSSDLNWGTENLMGAEAPPWDALDAYWDMSPMKYIGNAKTPTLLIHSEQDLRCQREQGEQVFVALRRLGVETELALFPEESHGLSRDGRTDRRIARLGHMLRWFETHLK
ncbi:MAG: S9 family peptidase [Ardenticatenaceae bacterium]|nr:S9 family peptidase [Ardenticatenaceae bacterium]MCB8990669.1 S9 family peptidase [Ardenticatenaceae bacterium]